MPSGVGPGLGPAMGLKDGPGTERRGSTSSEGSATSSSTHTRSLSMETAEYLQAAKSRASIAAVPKPPTNPLQFVKVGPCHLFRSAQEQLKKAEEVKRTKDVRKEEQEDWQSNLDNWKSSRRKQVEHIIERCVEVKKLELEEHDRGRRRSKTFNEMMEDRVGRRSSRAPLPIYSEEDNNDLSDLGIGTSSASGKSSLSEDCDNHSLASDGMDLEKNHSDLDNMSCGEMGNRKLGSSANEYDTCTTATISSPEPEEYTYEGAIQNYKSRIISRTQSTDVITNKINGMNDTKEKSPDNVSNGVPFKRASIGSKIENKLSSFELRRESSVESNVIDGTKKSIPKVDILKKREMFEKESSPEQNNTSPKVSPKPTSDFANAKSIKERLSHLEKLKDDTTVVAKPNNRLSNKVSSVKDRLNNLEKYTNDSEKPNRLSNGDLTKSVSLKDRLSNLNTRNTPEKIIVNNSSPIVTQSIKDRLANLDSACNKEPQTQSAEKDFNGQCKFNGYSDSNHKNEITNFAERNNTDNGMLDLKRFHRSLDSLDTDDNPPSGKFERIQSLDDLCGDAGTGGDTDREDSGIHTGDVSCAVSQDDEPVENYSLTMFGASTNSQDTVIQAESVVDELPVQDIDDNKDEYYQTMSHTSVPDDDSMTQEDSADVFFEKEEDDTVKSVDADNSVFDALDSAFQMIDCEDQPDTICISMEEKYSQNISDRSMNGQESLPAKECDVRPIITENHVKPVPLYENIDLLYSGNNMPVMTNDIIGFPLGPPKNNMQPPKEKPPPPPIDDMDDLSLDAPLKRINSTKRIKKEIRNKRSSFLGIEGADDDSYLEPELKLAPRHDITTFLQEESRVEKLLYRKSLYYDSDSNLGESRDSGVELDRGHSDDTWSNKQSSPDVLSEQHSRQGSEPFTNTSLTSEEDDIMKKDRDSIDGRMNDRHFSKGPNVIGQQLTNKLMELEQEKMHTKQSRINGEMEDGKNRIRTLDEQIREQQKNEIIERCDSYDDGHSEEVLRVERELLQLEQEELKRQRDSLMYKENQARRINGRSLQDINMVQSFPATVNKTEAMYSYAPPTPAGINYRQSMPDLAMKQSDLALYSIPNKTYNGNKSTCSVLKKLPPPIPPSKPNRSIEMQEREITLRNSRAPSAEYSNIDEIILRQKPSSDSMNQSNGYSHNQMTRHTLQALSAAPRSRLIPAADWLQPKRRSEPPQNYNINQHWLIQEAEQRRIDQLRSNIKKQSQAAGQTVGNRAKHLPDSVIQTLTQRVQNMNTNRPQPIHSHLPSSPPVESSEKMLSVSGKKKCSHCGEELGRGAAMIIESLRLFYHLSCFQCCVCGVRLGDGRLGADVRVRHNQLHCHNCYSSDDGVKFSCV